MSYPGYPSGGGYPQQQGGGYPQQYPQGGGYPPPGGPGYPGGSGYPAAGPGYPPAGGQPAQPVPAPRRDFYIVSQLNGLVLDISGGGKAPDTKVITYTNKGQKNQQWYTDPQGHIHSALHDFVLYDNGSNIVVRPASNDPKGQWYIDGQKILNRAGNSLDIKGESGKEGAEIISYKYHGGKNQLWNIQYI